MTFLLEFPAFFPVTTAFPLHTRATQDLFSQGLTGCEPVCWKDSGQKPYLIGGFNPFEKY